MRRPSALIVAMRRGRAALALAATLCLVPVWLCLPGKGGARRVVERCGWAILLGGFGIRLRLHGPFASPSDALIVSNHISWVDIAALARLADAGFVAKAEIEGWPVLGPLARRYGCLFVDRGSRTRLRRSAAEISAYPPHSGLILFPEGTTGDGSALLPFRSGLFAAIGERWPRVQPVTIRYRNRDGSAASRAALRRIAWLDDDALLPHAFALAASGGALVDIWAEAPFVPLDRKHAAEASRRAIAERLAATEAEDQAATLKRAA